MKASFINFWRRNQAAARLAILSSLEYRVNFLIDAFAQPLLSGIIEVALWSGMFTGMGVSTLGGFGRTSYLAYALWSTFLGRVIANWSYEFKMLEDIDTGRINSILVRPISFYEFYLSQFLGYKGLMALTSFAIPAAACLAFDLPFRPERLPVTALLILAYLVMTHTLSFLIAACAFFMNRAQSITGLKNMAIWVLAGELIPLDLYPETMRGWLMASPFAAGVYVPVGYLTGRLEVGQVSRALGSVALGGAAFGVVGFFTWRRGVREYVGTGA